MDSNIQVTLFISDPIYQGDPVIRVTLFLSRWPTYQGDLVIKVTVPDLIYHTDPLNLGQGHWLQRPQTPTLTTPITIFWGSNWISLSQSKFSKWICKIYTSLLLDVLMHFCWWWWHPFRYVFCHSSFANSSGMLSVTNTYIVNICTELCGLSEFEWYLILLGDQLSTYMGEVDIRSFRLLDFKLVN
jgi:hypothetical protein